MPLLQTESGGGPRKRLYKTPTPERYSEGNPDVSGSAPREEAPRESLYSGRPFSIPWTRPVNALGLVAAACLDSPPT